MERVCVRGPPLLACCSKAALSGLGPIRAPTEYDRFALGLSSTKLAPFLLGDRMAKEGSAVGFGLDGPTKTSSFCKTECSTSLVPGSVPRDRFFDSGNAGKSSVSGAGDCECVDRLRGLSMIAERCLNRPSGMPCCLKRFGSEMYDFRFRRLGLLAGLESSISSFDPRAPQPPCP